MRIPEFQNHILSWYKRNRRDMPWRRTKNPYRILVSEVMLQQTQVSRVLVKYPEFLRAFPTLEALAKVPKRKLLQIWSGLGYWRRALYLQKACSVILRQYQGKFPRDPKLLERLPGVGHYTARALTCFSFGASDAFLDTNIRRTYIHFFFPKRKNVSDKQILRIAKKALYPIWYDRTKHGISPREWHYALFDYGALVLKDKKINRQSKHYTKQKKFEGSFRSFRTKIMRFLLEQPNQKATLRKIETMLKKSGSPYSSKKILSSLQKDDLIKKRRRSYSL
ncbi:MAG: A/G-specific adenine glycosylase [Parcubacteria group bacterium]|nr:A/G-specific adenine glycosylase [Parcubacteria group bacterium]